MKPGTVHLYVRLSCWCKQFTPLQLSVSYVIVLFVSFFGIFLHDKLINRNILNTVVRCVIKVRNSSQSTVQSDVKCDMRLLPLISLSSPRHPPGISFAVLWRDFPFIYFSIFTDTGDCQDVKCADIELNSLTKILKGQYKQELPGVP